MAVQGRPMWSKVTDFVTKRKRVRNFLGLLVTNNNLGHILHRFGDTVVYRSKNRQSQNPLSEMEYDTVWQDWNHVTESCLGGPTPIPMLLCDSLSLSMDLFELLGREATRKAAGRQMYELKLYIQTLQQKNTCQRILLVTTFSYHLTGQLPSSPTLD